MTKSYQINIIIRITLIIIVSIVTGWMLNSDTPLYNTLTAMLLAIIIAINLAWYINNVNRKINYFFDAVLNEDYSATFSKNKGDKLINKLNQNLQRINEHIENIRLETINQEKYFEALIEHISVGIMSISDEGFVVNANDNLKRLLGLKQLTHIRQVEKTDKQLTKLIESIKPNDERTITTKNAEGSITILVRASSFRSSNQRLKLISMQDIKKELDQKELDSWLKLIRVLTHEIMNSIAPVTSLSENLCNQFIKQEEPISTNEIDEALINRTIQGLKVIQEQGQGLTRFVETYRKLTRLPKPKAKEINVKSLFEEIITLFKSAIIDNKIEIAYSLTNDDQTINADKNQISQVLINLLKNAAVAIADIPKPLIKLSCKTNELNQIEISVIDNGQGIAPDLIDEIFVPFFTTHENGNGIGLSISKQIMLMHKGNIKVKSIPNKETILSLIFLA